jgi:type III restriction enzyme
VALKMATGSGKTVVMAMLIAWQTLNKVYTPNDARFAKRFLVVAPGITIRNRLRVLLPSDQGNYFKERDLVPHDLWAGLQEAQVLIVNYHQFLLRDRKEIKGVASNTRKILKYGKTVDPFVETPDEMVARVLRDFLGRGKGEIVVLNDEAHHCYQNKPLTDDERLEKEDEQRNADARVWFKGLQAVKRKVGIKTIYDLSATPFYLQGSGYNEGFIFPWVVSDFSLMDAIESGIVKVPRLPVDDDASSSTLAYRNLWQHVGTKLPKRKAKQDASTGRWPIPDTLEGALRSLYRSYEKAFARWEQELQQYGETPPVFIVVCPNTLVSKLVYDWIGGLDIEQPDGTSRPHHGELPLLSNVENGSWIARPRTILIDSAQLESGEALKDDFKQAVGQEIEQFKTEMRNRNPSADVDNLTDEDLLREVMNTVGKKGRLGEGVRCVVSVSMLTEGWDANTVTHILGIRAFHSRLLCEQVVGRALRRRSYAVNDDGCFDAEYAEVYGVPFDFIPSDRVLPNPKPKTPTIQVHALAERGDLRITFPKLEGYRVEVPDERLHYDFTVESNLHVDKQTVATWTSTMGWAGTGEEHELDEYRNARKQRVAYEIADVLLTRFYPAHDGVTKPWLFPQLVHITKIWLDQYVTLAPGCQIGLLRLAEARLKAAERIFNAIVRYEGVRPEVLRPRFLYGDPEGSTDRVDFLTRKVVIPATKSHVNYTVLDGPKGNTWEEALADLFEHDPRVAAYVKNDHLGFTIPYLYMGVRHDFIPDFLVRLHPAPGDNIVRTLILEVSGGRKDQAMREAKAETARYQWCVAVNNHGGYGVWGFAEVTDMTHAAFNVKNAIDDLYANGVTTGAHT